MKRWFQFGLVLALVASLVGSSQAEICPMTRPGQHDQPCSRSMPSMNIAHHHATQAASGHDCCPKGAAHHQAVQPQCLPREISACVSALTCCSLDPQPQSLSQVVAVEQPSMLGTVNPPLLPPSRAGLFQATPLATPENPVFRLKEDLRI